MNIDQIYTSCLSQASYFIEDGREAAVIDPLRDINVYIERAQDRNTPIKYIFETHFHADFVSGHLDLAKATGATIVYGPNAAPSFEALIGNDGQIFQLGNVSIKLLHTPGHTLESCCYLLSNNIGKEIALFSGDTLFMGDVGRPDLVQAAGMSMESMAGLLYDSLQNKILNLPEDIIIYPGHGAGSACGKNISDQLFDFLGHQKIINYSLRADITKEAFITEVTTGLAKPPQYFLLNAAINRQGYASINDVIKRGSKGLEAEEVLKIIANGNTLILDARSTKDFSTGHLPGAVNIGLDGNFAHWVGSLIIDIYQPILIVCDHGKETEIITRLARVGYDNSLGYLKGGFDTWTAKNYPIEKVQCINTEDLADLFEDKSRGTLLDVRKKTEFDLGHITGAINVPLDYINDLLVTLDKNAQYFVYCEGGYRSMIFISILKAKGFKNLININGGFKAMKRNERFFINKTLNPIVIL